MEPYGYGTGRQARTPLAIRGGLVPLGPSYGTPPPPSAVKKLSLGQETPAPSGGMPEAVTARHFDVSRVVTAGGNLTEQILHPAIIPFEQLYRRLPEEGMFSPTVSPNNPFAFELGAFSVPDRMALMLFDLRPDIYRFSGVDAGDYLPIEARRFGSIMGFDITVDQQRKGQISFEIDPVAIQRTSQQAFVDNNMVRPVANAGQFAIGEANSFSNVAGVGVALQPQRPTRYGALSIPFTIIARSRQTIQTRCVIFRPLPAPIAFVEYDMAGVLVPEFWLDNMVQAIKPPQNQADEGIR